MQVAVVVQQIRARRHIADLLRRQIHRQQIRAPEADPLARGEVSPVPDVGRSDNVLLPAQRDAVAGVEGEDDVVGHVPDAVAAIGTERDDIEQLREVLHVGGQIAIGGPLVIDVDLSGAFF